ncbi:hypothetical protein TWF718_010977 [Orbilia javanica]|uniref:Uncharacterized protein n=1 Tax=Orbilia javanica TaxID=47235 RepID=A0AAN8MGM5_9PEZI
MDFPHHWIQKDLGAELQRLEEASQQLRRQRNSVQSNRSHAISSHAKVEYQAQLKANPKSRPTLKPIPESEHYELPYDKTLVTPSEWAPSQHIQSPLRESKHCVQIVQITSGLAPGEPLKAVVTDGQVSVPAVFKPCDGWTKSSHPVRTGAIFQIRRYSFRFPGTCSNSWEEGLTRNDQLSLAQSKTRKSERPKTLTYPSIPASIATYQWEKDFRPADGPLLDITVSKLLPAQAPHQEDTILPIGSIRGLMGIVNQFPTPPIRVPGLDIWCTEIIEEVARIWYAERAWYRFSQATSPRELIKLPGLKTTFLQRLQTDGKTKAAVRKARKNVFEPMYRAEVPIGTLFEIKRAYRDFLSLLKRKRELPILRIPGTNRPLQGRSYSPTPGSFRTNFQSQDAMTSTPQFATQFLPARHASGARREKEPQNTTDLEKRIARFQYDLDPVECENFSEIVRTLYARARSGDFGTDGDTSLICRHISDFYATKILGKVEITRVETQLPAARPSHPAEVKRERIPKAKPPPEPPSNKATTIAFHHSSKLANRERLRATLARLEKADAHESATKASRSPVMALQGELYLSSSATTSVSRQLVPGDKLFSGPRKKASSKSLNDQDNVKTPVARYSTPSLSVGEPMEGITMHMGPKHQEQSSGLRSKVGRLSSRRSMPTTLDENRDKYIGKHTQSVSSTKRKPQDRLSHPGSVAEHGSQVPAPSLAPRSPVVLDSTPVPSEMPILKLSLKGAKEPSAQRTPAQSVQKQPTPGTGRSTPATAEDRKVASISVPFENEQEQHRSALQHPQPRKKAAHLQTLEMAGSPSLPQSRDSPPAVVKTEQFEAGSAVTSHTETHGSSRLETEVAKPPQAEDLLTRLNKMLQLIQNEKDLDKILPERTKVPKDQAEILSKHTSLWPPPKPELQKHMRVIPNLEPRVNEARTCRFPEDFEPYNSTIETATQSDTGETQKGKQKADLDIYGQSENLAPGEQHVFTLTNQPASDNSDDDKVVDWEATPPSQLIDPLDRENEVFENSDAESTLDDNPPPASCMQTPEVSKYERTPNKVKNTPVNTLRRAAAANFTPPVKRVVGIPLRSSSPAEDDDFVTHKYQKSATTTIVTTTDTLETVHSHGDTEGNQRRVVNEEEEEDDDDDDEGEDEEGYQEEEAVEVGDEKGWEEDGEENGEKVEALNEEAEDSEEYDEEEEEYDDEEEDEESEVQVLQTQSSPNLQHRHTPQPREPQLDQVVQVTPIAISSSQFGNPVTPRGSPNVSKRKADQISISPFKAGSAVSPMTRGPKILKIEGAEQIGETLVKRTNAAIASSKESVRQDLHISREDLEKGKPEIRGQCRRRLGLDRTAYFDPSRELSDSD